MADQIEAAKRLLAHMAVKWPHMDGASARKIDALLHQRREAAEVITALIADHTTQAQRIGELEAELRRHTEHLSDFDNRYPMDSSTDVAGALWCAQQLLLRSALPERGERVSPPEGFLWRCGCCTTTFRDTQEVRPEGRDTGPKCPTCSAYGQFTYRETAHRGDPCIYCHTQHDEIVPGPCPALDWQPSASPSAPEVPVKGEESPFAPMGGEQVSEGER